MNPRYSQDIYEHERSTNDGRRFEGRDEDYRRQGLDQGRGREPRRERDYIGGRNYSSQQGGGYAPQQEWDSPDTRYGRGSMNYPSGADENFTGGGSYPPGSRDHNYSQNLGGRFNQERNVGESYDRIERGIYYGNRPQEHGRNVARAEYGQERFGYEGSTPQEDMQQRSGAGNRGRGPKGYQRTDERLQEDVCERLCDDPHIDASDITVTVKEGIVTLDGCVDSRATKHRVEDVVDACSGVLDISNRLSVGSQHSSRSSSANAEGNKEMQSKDPQQSREQQQPKEQQTANK